MPEPLSDESLDLLRKIAARDWLDEGDDPYRVAGTLHDLLPDLLAEVDQLREGSEVWQEHWQTDDEVDRLRAANAALIDTVRRTAYEMDGSGNYSLTGWAHELLIAADQAEGTS